MRQPASVYVRAARLSATRFYGNVRRRVLNMISRDRVENSQHHGEPRAMVYTVTLRAAMDSLGLSDGDVVMVHSGISHLGKVVGGSRAVFELIRERVGDRGHVLYPVYPFNSLMYSYLKSNPTFDVRTAPSKMGALSQYALNSPGGLRSVHPTHSVLAFGPRSAEFVRDHHLCLTPFAGQSPFARLVDFRGKILLIGVGTNSLTSVHRTEDRLGERFPIKVYRPEVFRIRCVDAQGLNCEVSTQAHDPFISRIRGSNVVREEGLKAGILREVPVGNGVIGIIDSRLMDQLLEDLCRSRSETIYGKVWG
jgi:aminoglycoside 3-N-acetyltransferase